MRWLSAQGTRLSQPQGAARLERLASSGFGFGHQVAPGLGLTLSSLSRTVVRHGAALGIGSSGTGGTVTLPSSVGSVFTLVAVCSFRALGTTTSILDRDQFSGPGYRCFQIHKTTSNTIQFIRFDTAGNPYFATTAASVAAVGDRCVVVARSNGSGMAVWLNGQSKATGTISNTPKVLDQTLYLAASASAGSVPNGQHLNGDLLGWAVLPFALSDADAENIGANPWQLFAAERRIWVPVSAGGGSSTNLVIQSALHAHTADGPTLTTDSTLAIADALHAHSADAPTLSTELLLSVADALHGHAAESLTLDTGVALAVADAAHGHTADGLTLVTDSVLAVADALHAHAADNLTLTADGAVDLVIQDALHGHTADELTLSATGAGGYYDDDPKRVPRKREKLTVIHKDDSDERSQEFEALLARVKGQALDKAKSAAQAAPVATPPADIKPPRMPEIRGVEASLLRQWMPDLLSTYRATFTAELQALASAQQAAAQAQMRALQRQQYEDEEIAILAMLA